jgi:hypothetical protein
MKKAIGQKIELLAPTNRHLNFKQAIQWFLGKPVESFNASVLSPWALACAVGTLNGSLAGHDEMHGISFPDWFSRFGVKEWPTLDERTLNRKFASIKDRRERCRHSIFQVCSDRQLTSKR